MKNILQNTFLAGVLTCTVLGAADLINGNWYGQAVDRIIYTDWGQSGTYNQVVDMTNGQCKTEPTTFSGSLSPLNGEVSLHLSFCCCKSDNSIGIMALQRTNAFKAIRVLHTRL